MSTDTTTFVTLYISHGDCEKCADAADTARTHASVTGSTGATVNDDHSRVGGTMHIAVVKRAHLVEPGDYTAAAQQVAADHAMDARIVPGQELFGNRQAPAAEALAEFIRSTALASQAIPGSQVRMGVLRWANDQGYNARVRVALGDLVLAIVNSDPQEMGVR